MLTNEQIPASPEGTLQERKKESESSKPEVLKVGGINVHLLPFDHVDGPSAVPQALTTYRKVQVQHPDVIPVIEYFPPEIDKETGYKPPAINSDAPINPTDEFANIRATYGAFVDQAGIDRVLVVDPAFNKGFAVPEFLPIIGGIAAAGIVFKRWYASQAKGNGNDDIMNAATTKKFGRGKFLRGAIGTVVALSGLSTSVNQQLETQTGYMKGYNPPDLPGAVISETDFRMLTIVRALEQLGQAAGTEGTQNVVLVYPPAHLERIKNILQSGTAAWIAGNIKSNFYKTLYTWFNIMKIRDWRRSGSDWQKVKEDPIDFTLG